MIKQLIRLLSFVAMLTVLWSLSPKQEKKIIWSKDRPLTWDDFKGRPLSNSSAGAITSYGIRRQFIYDNGFISLNIGTLFNTEKSWVKIEDKIPSTLKHEQLHFDIAELYARQMRKIILSTKFKSKGEKAKKQFLAIYEEQYRKLNICQEAYDKETTSPRNEIKQKEWLDKIAKELLELEAYSNPVLKIKIT